MFIRRQCAIVYCSQVSDVKSFIPGVQFKGFNATVVSVQLQLNFLPTDCNLYYNPINEESMKQSTKPYNQCYLDEGISPTLTLNK